MTDTLTIADVTAAPERESRFRLGSYDRKPQRRIERAWVVRDDGANRIMLELDCSHTRGQYVATVNNARSYGDGTWSTMPFNAKRLMAEPTARYSKPAFEGFADLALVRLRDVAADGELDEYLEGAHAPSR